MELRFPEIEQRSSRPLLGSYSQKKVVHSTQRVMYGTQYELPLKGCDRTHDATQRQQFNKFVTRSNITIVIKLTTLAPSPRYKVS